jgi:hypothetical protein
MPLGILQQINDLGRQLPRVLVCWRCIHMRDVDRCMRSGASGLTSRPLRCVLLRRFNSSAEMLGSLNHVVKASTPRELFVAGPSHFDPSMI